MGMPSKGRVFEHWKAWLDYNMFDWGEPSCWACGKWCGEKYDVKSRNETNFSALWNKVPLQRCHIIPKALGGRDEPENLFLMCSECHDLAPDTTSRDAFLLWASKQNYSKRLSKQINEQIEFFDLQNDKKIISKIIKTKEFNDWMDINTTTHWFQVSGSGNKESLSTYFAAISEYIKRYK